MNKTVIVTGASGNLGRSTVDIFLKNNWMVEAIINQNSTAEFDKNKLLSITSVDVSDEDSVAAYFENIRSKYQTIDALLCLVGGYSPGNISETKKQNLVQMTELNFYSAFHISRLLFEQMKKHNQGRIILIGSGPAIKTNEAAKSVAYALSKSLLFKFAEILNYESKEKNLKTFVVVPTTIDTPLNRKAMPDADFSKWLQPETIGEKIFQLCSTDINSINPVIEFD